MAEIDWQSHRREMMLESSVINLNTGSFGPLPKVVFQRATALRQKQAEEPMDFLLRQLPPILWTARERLAAFLGGRPERLVFTTNVSAAINLVASSLQLAAQGEILLTDHEYGAMHWCWERAAQRLGMTLRTFPLPVTAENPDEIVAAFRAAIGDRTQLAFFSHILSPTGLILPVEAMCREARKRGILTVIDGAHAPGMIPVNLERLPCDFYAGNCHKWMLAPTGSGFLYLGAGNEARLQPLHVSWGYHPDPRNLDARDEFGSTARIRFLEFEGTRDLCPWLAVPEAIDFQAAIGWDAIRSRNLELAHHARHTIADKVGLQPHTPVHPELHGFLTAFRLPPATVAPELRKKLWDRRIEAPVVERPDGLLIRVSTHFYNSREEIDLLAAGLRDML